MVKFTLPLPAPLPGDCTEIQGSEADAAHAQAEEPTTTPKLPVPPAAGMEEPAESTPYPQGARAITFSVVGMDRGEFTPDSAVSVNAPLYCPGASPDGLKLTLMNAGVELFAGATLSHEPPLVCAENEKFVEVLVT